MQIGRFERAEVRIERLDVAYFVFVAHHGREIFEIHAGLGLVAFAIVAALDERAKRVGSHAQARAGFGNERNIGFARGKNAARRGERGCKKTATMHS